MILKLSCNELIIRFIVGNCYLLIVPKNNLENKFDSKIKKEWDTSKVSHS